MKTLLKIITLFSIPTLSLIFIFLLSLKISNFSAEYIKRVFENERIYNNLYDELDKQINEAIDENDSENSLVLVGPFLQKEITPGYLKQKTERLIDDTDAWVKGKTTTPPVISFLDIKEKLIKNKPQIFEALQALNQELKAQKVEIKKQALQNSESIGDKNTQIPDFDLDKILNSDFAIPVGKQMGFIKNLYWYTTQGFIIISLILISLLLLIVILSIGIRSKLRWLGMVFILSSLLNFASWITASLGIKAIIQLLTQNDIKIPSVITPFINAFIDPLTKNYLQLEIKFVAAFITIGFVCFILSFSLPSSSPVKKNKNN